MFTGFEPCFNKKSQVLILGSFPSVKSRSYGFYYGNKQNRFWKMLENVFEEKIEDNIEAKKQFLIKHKIALYDIVSESDLSGSADEHLVKSQKKLASIDFILPPNTEVKKILCNGKASYNLTVEALKEQNIPIIYLPSTSPANVSFDMTKWQSELEFLK